MRKIIQPRKLLTFTAVNEQHGKRKMPRSTLLSLPVIAAMLLMPLPSEGTTKNVSGGSLESLRKWSNTGSGLRFVRFSARSTTFYSTSENRTNRKPGPRSIAFRNNVRTSFRSSGARCL